jgi:hypothetical protein
MLPKFFAAWLVVLVIVPFTAPFSTCDLTGLLESAPQGAHRRHAPFAPPASAAVTNDVAVPTAPCISTAGRVRLLPLSGLPLAQAKISSSSRRFMWSGASADCIREHTVLSTILRL